MFDAQGSRQLKRDSLSVRLRRANQEPRFWVPCLLVLASGEAQNSREDVGDGGVTYHFVRQCRDRLSTLINTHRDGSDGGVAYHYIRKCRDLSEYPYEHPNDRSISDRVACARSSTLRRLQQYRTPNKNKKQKSWFRLNFLCENGYVLHQRQYDDSRISYLLQISACLSYCTFSQKDSRI